MKVEFKELQEKIKGITNDFDTCVSTASETNTAIMQLIMDVAQFYENKIAGLQAAQPQWQLIETAPKDERIIVYFEEGFWDFAIFDSDSGDFFGDDGDEMYGLTPVYWMPQPTKPV